MCLVRDRLEMTEGKRWPGRMGSVVILVSFGIAFTIAIQCLRAQDATQPTVDASPTPIEQEAAPLLVPSPTPVLPELSQLDQAFKQTGLGKDADDMRARIEMRKLQNQVARDPSVVAAKEAADAARTDLEKRDRMREYYNINYGLMSRMASSSAVKAAIEQSRKEHLALLSQPRVRPETGEPPAPTPKKRKHRKSGKRF
jgi:hypothetical protein